MYACTYVKITYSIKYIHTMYIATYVRICEGIDNND